MDIFQRAFASQVFPPHLTNKLGIKHVNVVLLYESSSANKIFMACRIRKLLNGREQKVVQGLAEDAIDFAAETWHSSILCAIRIPPYIL
ncbi:vesicle-fusing ATPase-like isoform X2 [Phoenix dactylifera]|uniref:Vesicle-fusing ATPase n=1 Tax=Phoenix dactylifera TaxID=42345 RepID=A0A8B8ZY31_PHODC|nr:vesicle-fusing ATPase-like isoform X2 [Phoenix dactylifera]